MNIDDIRNLLKLEGSTVTLTGPNGHKETTKLVGLSQKNGNNTLRVQYPDRYDDIYTDNITSAKVTITIDIGVNSL